MASEFLSVDRMLAPQAELKRQFRWVIDWEGIDTAYIKSFARPNINLGEIMIDYLNTKRYFTGKAEWQTVAMTVYDPISPSQAQKFMEWVRKAYENVTGRAGYKESYVARDFKLKMLDPVGVVVEQWDFINLFPTTVDYQGLDYGTPDAIMVNATFRFDMAILQFAWIPFITKLFGMLTA
jgi:hypothetical protein